MADFLAIDLQLLGRFRLIRLHSNLAHAIRDRLQALDHRVGSCCPVLQRRDVALILVQRLRFRLQAQDPSHRRRIVLGELDALAGGGLVLEAILTQGQLIELIHQGIRECVSSNAHDLELGIEEQFTYS